MNELLHYKGYAGSVAFSEEDGVFHGKVVGIAPLISFEGDSVASITADFHDAVDEYAAFCANSHPAFTLVSRPESALAYA
jgi:predicted HicB family RNase H-like nuclease